MCEWLGHSKENLKNKYSWQIFDENVLFNDKHSAKASVLLLKSTFSHGFTR